MDDGSRGSSSAVDKIEKGSTQDHDDFKSWLDSIVDYVKSTEPSCLDFRTVSLNSRSLLGADLDFLVTSAVTEVYLGDLSLTFKVQDWCKILPETKIEKFSVQGLNVNDILTLMTVLKDTRLAELDISQCSNHFEYEQVDEFFAQLENAQLKSLNFAGCRFAPVEKISVFSQRLRNTKITRLNLSGVFIRLDFFSHEDEQRLLCAFIQSLQHTSLTDLNLSQNDLLDFSAKVIGEVLGNTKLEKLDLSGNEISDVGVKFLVLGLVRSKISHLNLSNNEIIGDNGLMRSLKDTRIKELDLSENPLTHNRMFPSLKCLQGSSVKVLKLGGRIFEFERAQSPIRVFLLSELTCLDLSDSGLTLKHCHSLVNLLKTNHSSLSHLSLFRNAFSARCYSTLGECLQSSALKYIDLGATARWKDSLQGISVFLNKTKSSVIVSVILKSNYLTSSKTAMIAPALANTKFLELDLSNNKFSNGIEILAPQLKLTAITALYLRRNDIQDAGAVFLAECLAETQIVVLDLAQNKITSHGAKALAQTFKKTKLRYLDLSSNPIEDDGLESLAENAQSSCITYLNVEETPGKRKLLVDRTLWDNRKKIQQFSAMLKRTVLFTGDSSVFEFDRDFKDIDIGVFIDDHLKLYKMVVEEPFIVGAIEQDKCILDIKTQSYCRCRPIDDQAIDNDGRNLDYVFQVLIEDCEMIFKKIMDHPSSQDKTKERNNISLFTKKILWLILEHFPIKFVSFLGEKVEADVEQHVSLLKEIEDLGLSGIVKALLLNRPLYMIDRKEDVLHPYVYRLLSKYKLTICNTDIEPEGLAKIIEYFKSHVDIDGACEVISLLSAD